MKSDFAGAFSGLPMVTAVQAGSVAIHATHDANTRLDTILRLRRAASSGRRPDPATGCG